MDKALSSAKESDHVWAIYDEFGEYVCAYPTESQARIAAKDYYKPTVKKVMQEELEEGIFDSKATKEAEYRKAIKEYFHVECTPMIHSVASNVFSLVNEAVESDHKDAGAVGRELDSLVDQLEASSKKLSTCPLSAVLNFGRKHGCTDSQSFKDIQEVFKKFENFKNRSKLEGKAYTYFYTRLLEALTKKFAGLRKIAAAKIADGKRSY
jgi:hypothetical protein